MSGISDARDFATEALRPSARGLSRVAPEVRLLGRFLGVLVFVTGALAIHLWTRMQVRETALALDHVRSDLVVEETLRDRLLVERTMLRSPARLGAIAIQHDLVAPTAVVDVVVPDGPPAPGASTRAGGL